jgi:tetratricopeptide (TPR) repeat protein
MFLLLSLPAGPDISEAAAASLAGVSQPQAHALIGELVRAHLLVERLPGRFSCHDLLRAFTAEQASAALDAAGQAVAIRRVLDWYLHTAAAAARIIDPDRRHVSLQAPAAGLEPLAFGDYGAALAWLEDERANLTGSVRQAAESGADDVAWKLPIELWSLFMLGAYWADWIAADTTGLASARALGDQQAQGWVLNHLAMGYQMSGATAEAIECFGQALRLRREMGDRLGEASVLANLGKTYAQTGRLADSMTYLQQAQVIFMETGQRPLQARTLMNLSGTQRRLGLLEDARDSAREAAAASESLGDRLSQAGALGELALACRLRGDPAEAAAQAARAAGLLRQTGDRGGLADVLMTLADALQASGDVAQAAERRDEARSIYEQIGDPHAAEAARRRDGGISRPLRPGPLLPLAADRVGRIDVERIRIGKRAENGQVLGPEQIAEVRADLDPGGAGCPAEGDLTREQLHALARRGGQAEPRILGILERNAHRDVAAGKACTLPAGDPDLQPVIVLRARGGVQPDGLAVDVVGVLDIHAERRRVLQADGDPGRGRRRAGRGGDQGRGQHAAGKQRRENQCQYRAHGPGFSSEHDLTPSHSGLEGNHWPQAGIAGTGGPCSLTARRRPGRAAARSPCG